MSHPDVMRSYSVTVTMTPRQAVAAMRSIERDYPEDRRAWRARERITFGMQDAGWEWSEDDESWHLPSRPKIKDAT